MNNNYTVYMHKNKINGKKYVGITCTTLRKRWGNGYGYKRHKYFYNAIQKYGWDNFEHSVIVIHLTLEQASEMEKMLIRDWDLLNRSKGYNIAEGGSNGSPFKGKTEEEMQEIRQKMSESSKGEKSPMYGKHLSEETKRKISKNHADIRGENHPMFGKHHTEETRKKLREKKKGENNPMYGRTGENAPWYGKHLSDEHRKKLREKKKGENNPMSIKVIAYTNSGSFYKEFACAKDAERELGVTSSNIGSCCKGKRKSAGKITVNGVTEKIKWRYK